MSRSTTYRPIELTAEERAELERKAHALQLAEEILPQLRSRWETNLRRAAVSLGTKGELRSERIDGLRRSLQTAQSVDEVRAAAAAILELERGALTRSDLRLPARPGLTDGRRTSAPLTDERPSSTEAAIFEIDFLDVELTALTRAAHDLGLTHDTADESRLVVDELRLLLLSGKPFDATNRLAHAAETMRRLRAEVDAARALVACQERTAETVTATLTRLGFDVSRSIDGGTISLAALAADGREADIEIAGADGTSVLLTADVDDPSSSVPEDDPAAGEVCIGAATVGVEVHRDLGMASGLEVGRVTAKDRPTRARPSATAKKRRPATNAQTRYRTRGAQ